MKMLVLGSGLMGPAAAYNALQDQAVTRVTLCDRDQRQLDRGLARLRALGGDARLTAAALDITDAAAARTLMAEHDVVFSALPWPAIAPAITCAVDAQRPLVDLALPLEEHVDEVKRHVAAHDGQVVLGCGVEPGLTEIMARWLGEKLDRVEEVHIKCGGIPERPTPPLGYKIVFGGRQLPLRDDAAAVCSNGRLEAVPRYSGIETVHFAGVGDCEAYHEGFMPWLLDHAMFRNLQSGTQMTVRWPGYAEKAAVLRDLGLLRQNPIEIQGTAVAPKDFLDRVLYPHVKLAEGERDITCFRVDVSGTVDGGQAWYRIEMVDRYDEATGFTSMARTTAFTGSIVARMAGRGEIAARGLLTADQAVTGPLMKRLVDELADMHVRFDITSDRTLPLRIDGP